MTADAYITLVASLPSLGPMLGAKYPPINRVQLQRRLRMLEPHHRAELEAVADLLNWSRLPLEGSDAALAARARRLIPALGSTTLRALSRHRLEMRTLVAALRRRAAGQDTPPRGTLWGYGRYLHRIEYHWRAPDFGMGRIYPWFAEARSRHDRGDVQGLERILLEESWQEATRRALGHAFDYEAVAIYVIRWNLLQRWTRYDAEAAAARFEGLVGQALGRFATTGREAAA